MDEAKLEHAIQGEEDLLRPEVRCDSRRLEQLLDIEFEEIGASGRRWSRDATIAELISSPATDVTVADMTARQVGDGVVLVTYATVARDRRVLRSSWWRESEGTWKCFFHQGTVVPGP